jgi:myo-inositol-1(or 4)-monophosphatase
MRKNEVNGGLLKEVINAAREAGGIILANSRRPREVRYKGRIDLVTETDIAVEALLREKLEEIMPGIGFLGEESADGTASGRGAAQNDCWIVDPVDGTTNFVHGIPFVAVSIALRLAGETRIGVVHLPFLKECFSARRGAGAKRNNARIRVSAAESLERALVATGFPYSMSGALEGILRRLGNILPHCRGVRRCGAAAADLAYVAAGRFDAFYESGLKIWDIAAGQLLVEEAGGRVTDMDGGRRAFCGSILASNGHIHEGVAELLMRGCHGQVGE